MASKSAELILKIKSMGEESLDKVGDALKYIGSAAMAAGGLLAGLATKAIADFREQEKATNALTQAMVNNGVYSKELRDDYLAQATALQKLTLFGDEQIIAAQAAAQQQIGNTKITKELTAAILDFAQAQGIDAASAATLVGKSIGTSTNALTRYGIEVNTAATETEKMAMVVEGLNSKFGGQATAAAQGLGALTQLGNIVSDLFETLGERIAPTVTAVANMFKALATDSKFTEANLNALVSVIQFLAKAGVYVVDVFQAFGDTIGIQAAAAVIAFSEAIKGNFKEAAQTLKDGEVALDAAMEKRMATFQSRMAALNEAGNRSAQEAEEQNVQNLIKSLDRQREIKAARVAEDRTLDIERKIAEQEQDLAMIGANEEQKLALEKQFLDKKIAQATDAKSKEALLLQKSQLIEKQKTAVFETAMSEFQKKKDEETIANRKSTLNTIATLQQSNNKALAFIGKAAALTQIAIDTPVAIGRALAAFPPPFNFAAAGAVGAAMAIQAGRIAGIPLAEGGIIPATPGGVPAIIGEGGQDEMVIPLDRAKEFGFGGGGGNNITIINYGGMLGSESEAYQFARAIDRELLNLRRNNDSVSFDRIT